MVDKKTTIQVNKSTRDRLASIGGKDDSFDTIINNLIMNRDISNQWNKFDSLNTTEQKEVCMKMHDYNEYYMFEVDTTRHYIGLKSAYFDDKEVRNALNTAMKELEYI